MALPVENPRGQQAVNISVAFTVLATITVVLRLWTRFFIVRFPGIEDYFITLATILSLGLTICIGFQSKWGMGMHTRDIPPEDNVKVLQSFWASLICYYLALGLTKTSILLQYQRVFPTKKFQISCWALLGVVGCYTIWTVGSSIFACVPVRAFWTKEPAQCIDQFAMWYTNATINILTDFAIIILPMPVIKRLQLGTRPKVALMGIFAVGGSVCIVSILRLHSLVAISNSDDPSYDNPAAATWSSVETSVGIICSCLPLLRPITTKCLPGLFSSYRRGTRNTPRANPTVKSTRSRPFPSHDEGRTLELTKCSGGSRRSSDSEGRDIQVVTDIHVRVENGEGQPDALRTPKRSLSGMSDQDKSPDTRVKDVKDIV